MALDDLGEKKKKETRKEETGEIAEKLGVEDQKDIQWLDDRLTSMAEAHVHYDKDIQELKEAVDELRLVNRAVLTILGNEGFLDPSPDVSSHTERGSDSRWQ